MPKTTQLVNGKDRLLTPEYLIPMRALDYYKYKICVNIAILTFFPKLSLSVCEYKDSCWALPSPIQLFRGVFGAQWLERGSHKDSDKLPLQSMVGLFPLRYKQEGCRQCPGSKH